MTPPRPRPANPCAFFQSSASALRAGGIDFQNFSAGMYFAISRPSLVCRNSSGTASSHIAARNPAILVSWNSRPLIFCRWRICAISGMAWYTFASSSRQRFPRAPEDPTACVARRRASPGQIRLPELEQLAVDGEHLSDVCHGQTVHRNGFRVRIAYRDDLHEGFVVLVLSERGGT